MAIRPYHIQTKLLPYLLCVIHSAAKPQQILLSESGEIASEKTLAMTPAIHFDGTQHIVIAGVCSNDFSRLGSLRAERSNLSLVNKLHRLIRSKWACEKLTKKEVITQ